ncbi:MAG: hypothetical protein U9R02_08890 [Thermodesulfobacteriota bacterium]|nr:hypothetical protein [Thermodesulfobacteriota bacterium]
MLIAESTLLDERYNAAVRIQRTLQRVMQLRKQIVSSWNNGLEDILFKQEDCETISQIDKSNKKTPRKDLDLARKRLKEFGDKNE